MITKTEARDVVIDWDEINRLTETPRTYLIRDKDGREFFKMYKPSEAQLIFRNNGWEGKIVSVLDKNARWKR